MDTFGPSDGRNTGLKMHNSALEESMTWGVGAFYDADGFGDSSFGDNNYTFAARVTGLPWYEEKGAKLAHLGLSYRHEFRDEDTDLRYRQRPATHMTDARIVDTGNFSAADANVINPELALVYGPFSLQGEYYFVPVDSEEGGDPEFDGFYISGSYFLTGEHRAYKRADGSFSRVKPYQNFHPDGSGWGAWEIGLRYSAIDLTDSDLEGGEASDITLGLNWYLNPNTRWMLNYVYTDLEDRADVSDGDLDIIEMRMQLDF